MLPLLLLLLLLLPLLPLLLVLLASLLWRASLYRDAGDTPMSEFVALRRARRGGGTRLTGVGAANHAGWPVL